jgi:hypothetical protein
VDELLVAVVVALVWLVFWLEAVLLPLEVCVVVAGLLDVELLIVDEGDWLEVVLVLVTLVLVDLPVLETEADDSVV